MVLFYTVFVLLCIVNGCFTKNVLFITIDDLRPDLGCYGGRDAPSSTDPHIYTPNIDDLARKSLLLKRAYVQQALCSPSRTSFLTGRRPDTTRVYDLITYFRNSTGNFTTIPQYFKEHGYMSIGMGKIFHAGIASGNDDPISWSVPFVRPNQSIWEHKDRSWKYVSDDQLRNESLVDSEVAQRAVNALKDFGKGGKYENTPFFLAVGFFRPHLPFVSPLALRSHYPDVSISLPPNGYAPVGMPDIAWVKSNEIRDQYGDIRALNASGNINTTFPDDTVKELRRAYYSAVSWIDSLVGMVVNELDRLGLRQNTVISLLGDHGFHLGEHAIWGKETNFEVGTHAPLMVSVPGLTDHGIVSEHLTEFVDLFPTLVDATGLPTLQTCPEDSAHVSACTEGKSLLPIMKDPNRPWKNAAFSQYPRPRENIQAVGYSIRTDQYRYTEWLNYSGALRKAEWDKVVGVELYDHSKDPEEDVNRAEDIEYASMRHQLRQQLRQGWRATSLTLTPALVG